MAVTLVPGGSRRPAGRVVALRTILLIKGDEALREFFAEALVSEGYRVFVARDGAEGLDLLSDSQPDLIVLGGQMPVVDGWEFLARYRDRPGPHAPTVGISVSDRALPVDAAVPQPFDLNTFLSLVRRYVEVDGRESAEE